MKPTEMKSTVLLQHHLKTLKLPTMLREHESAAQRCAAENVDHLGFLLQLCERKLLDRERRASDRRLKAARFPTYKTLDDFDFKAQPSINKLLVTELLRGEYLDKRENVLLVGRSGTGKTHLATALGVAVTLPAASDNAGEPIMVGCYAGTSGNELTVETSGSDKIHGNAADTNTGQVTAYDSTKFVNDGENFPQRAVRFDCPDQMVQRPDPNSGGESASRRKLAERWDPLLYRGSAVVTSVTSDVDSRNRRECGRNGGCDSRRYSFDDRTGQLFAAEQRGGGL